ncbi:MAG: hypothetical protein LBV48_01310 [Mycoplasmataceae bacterium]|jgi:hypothetical protein|nr:hypothetical protein [Mycoplasmataceae bacterium]
MAKTNFKEFQLKKDKTGSFISIGNKQNKKNIVQGRAHAAKPKMSIQDLANLILPRLDKLEKNDNQLFDIIKRNNLK